MKKTGKYKNKFWKKLAADLSGEIPGEPVETGNMKIADNNDTDKYWIELGTMNNSKEINVDGAWKKVISRIEENNLLTENVAPVRRIRRTMVLRIAAAAVIVVALGAALFNILVSDASSGKVTVASNSEQKNIIVDLPDGSKVWLNRSSELSYQGDLEKEKRTVELSGEAYFEIMPNTEKPFVIDAGNAKITVVGTSFNVISSNYKNEVEVYVKTGKVMLSDADGINSIFLEPEDIGTIEAGNPVIARNENANYLSWKTDLLIYDGENLDAVFKDLKRVYNITVTADDPEILEKTITATYDKEPQDTIIDLICTTFTLSYSKDGLNYRLSKR
jgi:ferric-dicitrate binding protein FerR (iron transport regulator)